MITINAYLELMINIYKRHEDSPVKDNASDMHAYSIKSYSNAPKLIGKPGTVIGTVIGKTTRELNRIWEKWEKDDTLWKH